MLNVSAREKLLFSCFSIDSRDKKAYYMEVIIEIGCLSYGAEQ